MKSKPVYTALFNSHYLVNCRGRMLDLSVPKVMGILNVTPDSFFDGGKFTEQKAIINHAAKMLAEGADIIDIGANSTRPGAKMVDSATELKRLLPAITYLRDNFPDVIISVDTFRARVAEKCIEKGVSIINDVSGGDLDKKMFQTVARLNVPYILMHMIGTPESMQEDPKYDNVVLEVTSHLAKKVSQLRQLGVHDIIIDPGFGFGKTVEHNYKLLNGLPALSYLGCPVLAGVSRKSMICKVLKINPENALNGTTALHMAALMKGASLLRVHDVKEAVQTVRLFENIKNNDPFLLR
ncbi:MAG: dihydropteroate synthase [Bacteroidota bacterium]|nr:dihydropteroate synthase [Bacteroidota bacterium]